MSNSKLLTVLICLLIVLSGCGMQDVQEDTASPTDTLDLYWEVRDIIDNSNEVNDTVENVYTIPKVVNNSNSTALAILHVDATGSTYDVLVDYDSENVLYVKESDRIGYN